MSDSYFRVYGTATTRAFIEHFNRKHIRRTPWLLKLHVEAIRGLNRGLIRREEYVHISNKIIAQLAANVSGGVKKEVNKIC